MAWAAATPSLSFEAGMEEAIPRCLLGDAGANAAFDLVLDGGGRTWLASPQVALINFAREALGIADATSEEFDTAMKP